MKVQVMPCPHLEDQGSNPHDNRLLHRGDGLGSKGTTQTGLMGEE